MTWLYVPNLAPASTTSACALEVLASTSASSWQFQTLERSVWLRGKPTPSRSWVTLWKRAAWLRRLSGRMPEPSAAARGVARWTASLAASRASHTATPAAGSARPTRGTFGPQLVASSSSPAPGGSLSKTSPACSPPSPAKLRVQSVSGETYSAWVSRLREAYSARLRSAALRNGSGFSSSLWQTPSVADASGGRANRSGDRQNELLLNGQVRILCFRLGLTTWKPGEPTSPATPRTSPEFPSALMGWPTRWTAGDCPATELSRFKRRMRSALSQLTLHAAPPAQLALFA